MKHNYKANEIISSIFFPRLIAELGESVLIFQKGDEKFALSLSHTQTQFCVIHKAASTKKTPVHAVLIQSFFIFSRQNRNETSDHTLCVVVCVFQSF